MSNKRMARFLSVVILLSMIAVVPVTIAYGTENESQLNNEYLLNVDNMETLEQEEKVFEEPVLEGAIVRAEEREIEPIVIYTEEPEEEPKELTLKDIVLQQVIRPFDEDMHIYVSNNRDLSEEEMCINARYVYYYLSNWGWSDNAIFAALGNMDFESTINPGRWQGGHEGSKILGFGIVQWTPGYYKVIKWANEQGSDPNSLYTQLCYLQKCAENNEEWISRRNFPHTFSEFTTDTEHDVTWLTEEFARDFERPASLHLSERVDNALKWEAYFNQIWEDNQ